MPYTLPELPYAYDALEPYIDKETMILHHTKHHQKYVDELNKALAPYPELQEKSLDALLSDLDALPDAIMTAVRNNGGGHLNHSLFWTYMKPNGGGKPQGYLGDALKDTFGEFTVFQEKFDAAAKTVFGSGWAWLVVDGNSALSIMTTPNQDSPVSQGLQPVMGLDVWEHAYYLKYQNRRPDYISAWWHVINWDQIEENYRLIIE